MFTNQKVLTLVFITLVFGAAVYFTFLKFRYDVISPPSTPSPTPEIKFVLTPSPTPTSQPQTQRAGPQVSSLPQSSQLPLANKKYLGQFPGNLSEEELKNKAVTLVTTKGNIVMEIFPEAPLAASNFLILASNGFYDNLTFHRVEPGVLIQGGDPKGDGTGDGGYTFEDELTDREYRRGIVAMANRGPDTNSTQFFIVISDNPGISKNYTIFGNVLLGMDVVERITPGDIIKTAVVQPLN